MQHKKKLFQILATLLFLLVVVFAYIRANIERNFPITGEIECNPSEEICFLREGEGENFYYKIATLPAYEVAACGLFQIECFHDFTCVDKVCDITLCSDENLPEGEECTTPEDFSDLEQEEISEDMPVEAEEEGLKEE